MSRTIPLAKLRILVPRAGELWCLMSRKRDTTHADYDKLELLGGHLERGESPLQALIRECAEEETTGRLAALVTERHPPFATKTVDGAMHHLFELTLSDEEASGLRAQPAESLGLRLVRAAELDRGELDDQLTYRTRLILGTFVSLD